MSSDSLGDSLSLRVQAARLRELGDAKGTLHALWECVKRDPDDPDAWIAFADALASAEFDDGGDAGSLESVLLACFLNDDLEHQRLARAAFAVLGVSAGLADAIQQGGGVDATVLSALGGAFPLLVLRRVVLPFPRWERLIRVVRARLLRTLSTELREALAGAPAGVIPDQSGSARVRHDCADLVCGLGEQGYLNGYAMAVSPAEVEQVRGLQEWVLEHLQQRKADPHADPLRHQGTGGVLSPGLMQRIVAIVSAYSPLAGWADLQGVVELAHTHPNPSFVALLVQQVEAPLAEVELRKGLPSLTGVGEGVSSAVRDQYEEHPYPRWLSVDRPTPVPPLQRLAQLFPHEPIESPISDAPIRILIAGCGTGRQVAGVRARYSDVEVFGVDLSRSSLAYAARRLCELGLDDVTLAQADILELSGWDVQFDWIECTGVLHHMEDPREGGAVLTALLRPGGVMKIALYSERARSDIVALRDRIRREGWVPTPESIRGFRARLLAEEAGGAELAAGVLEWPDFYFMNECRDLLFHVQEHRFTMEGIGELITVLGLDFMGFEVGPETIRRFTERHPAPGDLRSLHLWDQFEVDDPQTFRGMYQFWVRKPFA
jgi:SAM-dependent methyltransferase